LKADLGIAQKKVNLQINSSDAEAAYWKLNQAWIKRLSFIEKIDFVPKLKRVLYKNGLWELNLDIPAFDEKSFIASLEKKIGNLKRVFEKVDVRLKNQDFLKNAPQETVEEQKLKFKELTIQLKRLGDLKNAFRT
jgi:valyl-tRNA synthetase